MSRKSGFIKSSRDWKPISLDPELLGSGDFEGLVGIEELTNYSLHRPEIDSEVRSSDEDDQGEGTAQKLSGKREMKAKKDKNARHIKSVGNLKVVNDTSTVRSTSRWETSTLALSGPRSSRVTSENLSKIKKDPAKSNDVSKSASKKITISKKSKHLQNCTSDFLEDIESINPSDGKIDNDMPHGMDAWNGLGVPIPVMHALAQMGFTTPTNIQALTLPAAIFGRRDILGAAETGSGKTLAFGIPILSGILYDQSNVELEDGSQQFARSNLDSPSMNKPNDQNESRQSVVVSNEEDNLCSEAESDDQADDESNSESGNGSENESECGLINGDLIEEGESHGAELVKVIDNANFNFSNGNKEFMARSVNKPLYALILTPTRELAIQVTKHLQSAAKFTGIRTVVLVGGMSSQKQERMLNYAPEIVVATPGRLWDLISQGHPHLRQVQNIRYLAIDETDRMLERGHFEELQRLLDRINETSEQKKRRQNFVFSATLSLTHDVPDYIKQKKSKKKAGALKITPFQKLSSIIETVGLTNPKVVDITESSGVAHSLTEAQIICSFEEKDYYLYYFLLRYPGRTLVFCNSINCVKRLAQLFTVLKCPVSPLHANMHQTQRLRNLERFRDNPQYVLLATDVAARGLDIPEVQHVIHYQVPRTAESYVHRSGRTARAHQEGLTVILVEPGEVRNFSRLFHTLGRDGVLPVFPVEERFMPAVKQRVNLARQLELYELQERRSTSERGWVSKLAKEMDIEISDDEVSDETSSPGSHQAPKALKTKVAHHRKQLHSLLEKPLFPKGFSRKFPSFSIDNSVPHWPMLTSQNDDKSAITVLKQEIEKKRAEKRKNFSQTREILNGKKKKV